MILAIALVASGVANAAAASPEGRSCVEYGGRTDVLPVSHSKELRPPSVIGLDYPDLAGTTPARYPWPLRLDVLVDAEGRVRRVCTHESDQFALAPFGDALSRSRFRPARLRGQAVAYETELAISLPELEKARK